MKLFGNPTQAILPEGCEEYTISSMSTGEKGYTVPWAMWVDSERKCWLHPHYTISGHPGGTVQMKVQKRSDGYHVWLVDGERYSISRNGPSYVGQEGAEWIPVMGLH